MGEHKRPKDVRDDALVCPPSPMPTQEDWKRLFMTRIMSVANVGPDVAQAEYYALEDYDGNPEWSADECMSYWDADE
jgi:hypothetical protein